MLFDEVCPQEDSGAHGQRSGSQFCYAMESELQLWSDWRVTCRQDHLPCPLPHPSKSWPIISFYAHNNFISLIKMKYLLLREVKETWRQSLWWTEICTLEL